MQARVPAARTARTRGRASAGAARGRTARVGTLSFFTSTKAHEGHSGDINRTFDVTDELRQLAVSAAELKDVNVVFEATTGLAGATEASFDADAKLTVGEIELRVKAME